MKAMHQGDFKLSGRVDVDESSVGGKEPVNVAVAKARRRSLLLVFKC